MISRSTNTIILRLSFAFFQLRQLAIVLSILVIQACASNDDNNGNTPCNNPSVSFNKPEPYLMLMLDASSSMNQLLGNQTTFDTARSALFDANQGSFDTVQDRIAASAYTYKGIVGSPTCPTLTSAGNPTLNNATAIQSLINNTSPSDHSPLAESINAVKDDFNLLSLPADASKSLVIVTDDGIPDSCTEATTGGPAAVSAVQQAFQSGIHSYVVSIGATNPNEGIFTELANAGIGIENPTAFVVSHYIAADLTATSNALSQVFSEIETCQFVPAQISTTEFSKLSLELDVGQGLNTLVFGEDWVIVGNSSTIALVGPACTSFREATSPLLSGKLLQCGS